MTILVCCAANSCCQAYCEIFHFLSEMPFLNRSVGEGYSLSLQGTVYQENDKILNFLDALAALLFLYRDGRKVKLR